MRAPLYSPTYTLPLLSTAMLRASFNCPGAVPFLENVLTALAKPGVGVVVGASVAVGARVTVANAARVGTAAGANALKRSMPAKRSGTTIEATTAKTTTTTIAVTQPVPPARD